MSENFITLVPTNPLFVPTADALKESRRLFATFVPEAEKIEAGVTEEVTFVDQGGSFERVSCPKCNLELATHWWQQAMDKSYESRFQRLDVVTPCCTFATSLNDLDYHWPAGFARCWLRARGPGQKQVSPEQIARLERILGTALRQIWTHY
jgi:hypothetical protein